ncbi:calcium-binding protein [Fuscovulum blasticum]|uniref:calcium-binding protein n=1 Tax=Fuscovulum blasticum TaxID=1075 RepID=UPI0013DF6FC7|nr:calcium-binding protein [Fuscovulum blasticum]
MRATYQEEIKNSQNGTEVTGSHFGANLVAHTNFSIDEGPFDQATTALGVTHIRFPGGTITEQLIDPSGDFWVQFLGTNGNSTVTLPDGRVIQTLAATLEYASEHGLLVDIVLPTEFFLSEGEPGSRQINFEAIDYMVSSLNDFLESNPNSGCISTIEIGNEYYYDGRMTALEYAQIANYMVIDLANGFEALEEHGYHFKNGEPKIAVQAGAGWQPGDNQTILDNLSPEAKAEIDITVVHYYPKTLDKVGNFARHLNQLDDWRADPDFKDLSFWGSEWNIQNTDVSDKGMLQASAFVAAFQQLLLEGVDMASVWGTQYKSLDSRLSTLSQKDLGPLNTTPIDTDLTATGEVFSIMSRGLVGLHSADISEEAFATISRDGTKIDLSSADVSTTSFGSDSRYLGFISSRSTVSDTDVRLDLSQYFGLNGHVSIRVISAVDDPSTVGIDESVGSGAAAEPDLDIVYSGGIPDTPIFVQLPPTAILIVEVSLTDQGIYLSGQNPISDETFIDYEDLLVGWKGNDTLVGYSGDDTLSGGKGGDLLDGGNGLDYATYADATEGLRADLTNPASNTGDAAGDTYISIENLAGSQFADILIGDAGANAIVGNGGSDLLAGGAGNDALDGGEGNDTLRGGQVPIVSTAAMASTMQPMPTRPRGCGPT